MTSLLELPDGLLKAILDHLSPLEQVVSLRVCKKFKQEMPFSFETLPLDELTDGDNLILPDPLEFILQRTGGLVRAILCQRVEVLNEPPEIMDLIAQYCPNLKEINARNAIMTGYDLLKLPAVSKVSVDHLFYDTPEPPTGEVLQRLSQLDHLEMFSSPECELTSYILRAPIPGLRRISLQIHESLDEAYERIFLNFPKLEALSLFYHCCVTPMPLAGFEGLQELRIDLLEPMPNLADFLEVAFKSLGRSLVSLCFGGDSGQTHYHYLRYLEKLEEFHVEYAKEFTVDDLTKLSAKAPLGRLKLDSSSSACCDELLILLMDRRYPLHTVECRGGAGMSASILCRFLSMRRKDIRRFEVSALESPHAAEILEKAADCPNLELLTVRGLSYGENDIEQFCLKRIERMNDGVQLPKLSLPLPDHSRNHPMIEKANLRGWGHV